MAGKDALRHLAARGTSWPEYCLEAIDELISAVQELLHPQPSSHESPRNVAASSQSFLPSVIPQDAVSRNQNVDQTPIRRQGISSGREAASATIRQPNPNQVPMQTNNEPGTTANSDHVDAVTDAQQHQTRSSPRVEYLSQPNMTWQQTPTPVRQMEKAGTTSIPNNQVPPINAATADSREPGASMTALGQADLSIGTMPVEGQESIMWYDQLFASSFSAIDNPFLVAAEFDASIDPTWNYLR